MLVARRLREKAIAKRFPRDPISYQDRFEAYSVAGLVNNARYNLRSELARVLDGYGDVQKLIGHIDRYSALKERGYF